MFLEKRLRLMKKKRKLGIILLKKEKIVLKIEIFRIQELVKNVLLWLPCSFFVKLKHRAV
jgi:hypothetical protein